MLMQGRCKTRRAVSLHSLLWDKTTDKDASGIQHFKQVIQVQLWKMKSLYCELELAPNWHAWSVNRTSWDCLHQLIQTSLRQSLETKHHFFRSLCFYNHQPGLWEAQEKGMCSPLVKMDAGKNYSWPRCGGPGRSLKTSIQVQPCQALCRHC